MIEKYIYDAVVEENLALKREIEELKSRLIVQESYTIYDSPILPPLELINKDLK